MIQLQHHGSGCDADKWCKIHININSQKSIQITPKPNKIQYRRSEFAELKFIYASDYLVLQTFAKIFKESRIFRSSSTRSTHRNLLASSSSFPSLSDEPGDLLLSVWPLLYITGMLVEDGNWWSLFPAPFCSSFTLQSIEIVIPI